jgi:hypothetical protein
MFKKPTKKQFLIRRILLSVIATLAVIIIATVTILFMLGFRLDSGNRLAQGALLQFDSQPSGADVYVDGAAIGSRTATKQTVVAGTHTVKMTKNGYQDWARTLDLSAGTLTWLDYTRLVPKDRPVEKVTNYKTLAGLTISPDSKWALAQEMATTPTFQLVDLRSEAVKASQLVVPAALYSEPAVEAVAHSFSIVSWDSGSRYALVKHLYRDQTEWLVVDTQNVTQTINVTRLLSVNFKDLQFAGTSGKVLYGLTTDGAIRKVDLSAGTISRAFVTHVDSFSIFDNTIISYVGTDPNDATKRVAGVYRDGDESSHVLRSVTSADVVLKIAAGKYFNDNYVAIAEGNVVTILKGSYPSSASQDTSSLTQFAVLELTGAVSALSFSPSGDYVLAQSAETFKSYDIEHKHTDVGVVTVAEGKAASTLKWLDIAHVWNDDNGTLTMRDFNGINVYAIMAVEPGFSASLSQNGRFFYAVGKSDTGYHLQRVKMILD